MNFLYRNLTARQLYTLGLAVPLVCTLAICYLQFHAIGTIHKVRQIVRHMREQQIAVGVFRYSLSDAESCQFRYILNHNPADIDLYHKLMGDAATQLASLHANAEGNDLEQKYVDQIQPLFDEKKRLTDQSFQMEQTGDHNGAMAIISADSSRTNMLTIEKLVDDMLSMESAILAVWQNIYLWNFKFFSYVSILSVALCFGFIIAILLLLRHLAQQQAAVTLTALKELIDYEDGSITIEEYLRRRHAALLTHGPAQIEAERLLGLIERRKNKAPAP